MPAFRLAGIFAAIIGAVTVQVNAADAATIAFARAPDRSWNTDIWLAGAEGLLDKQLTFTEGHETSPAWSPDGSRIGYSRIDDAGWAVMYTMKADGTDVQRIRAGANAGWGSQYFGDWSPDGSRIVYAATYTEPGNYREAGHYAIFTARPDGSDVRQVTTPSGVCERDAVPSWSPDGTRIVFARSQYRGETSTTCDDDIFVVNSDGTGLANLTGPSWISESDPEWSPDGTRIAYSGLSYLQTMAPDGSDVRQLTSWPFVGRDPSWSPDSRRVAFMGPWVDTESHLELSVVGAAGQLPLRLTVDWDWNMAPAWRPCPPGTPEAPVTSASLPPGVSRWSKGTTDVVLSSTSCLDFVDHLNWEADGVTKAAGSVAGPSARVRLTEEGLTTLTYQATDSLGRTEPARQTTLGIDREAPSMEVQAPPSAVKNTISGRASDTMSGVARTTAVFTDALQRRYTVPAECTGGCGASTRSWAVPVTGLIPGRYDVVITTLDRAGHAVSSRLTDIIVV